MSPMESELTIATFFISLALLANSRVEMVSFLCNTDGEMFAIISVLLLPPSEFFKINVNLDDL
jgi:hypothetical protein